jgi:hypothetical protein
MEAAMSMFIPQTFNDLLCLFVLGAIITLWILDGFGVLNFKLNTEVMTATIIFFTLIGQYYYRKAKEEK